MTHEEARQLRFGGFYHPPQPIQFPLPPSMVCPTAPDTLAHVVMEKEADPSSYNMLSIEDATAMAALKETDNLHRPDMVSTMHKRGKQLDEFRQKVGDKVFVESLKEYHKNKK